MKKIYFLLLSIVSIANGQIINIPDANFKAKLLAANPSNGTIAVGINGTSINIDVNNNNEIELSEALVVYGLDVEGSNISNLSGIEMFTNLTSLECYDNQITSLNLISLVALEYLDCSSNQIANLNISGLNNLQTLFCQINQLTNLNVQGLNNLIGIECGVNQLTNLNLTGLNLIGLVCEQNLLTSLDVSQQTNLTVLQCDFNQISALNLNGLNQIYYLICNSNLLTTLDVSDLGLLDTFICDENPNLTSINMKNGSNEGFINFDNSPNLTSICADDSQVIQVQNLATSYGYTNCVVGSTCSLSATNFNKTNAVSVFPNPVNNILNINKISNTTDFNSITIYNTLGQIVLLIPDARKVSSIDVSSLKTGNYLVKIISDIEIKSIKFLKI